MKTILAIRNRTAIGLTIIILAAGAATSAYAVPPDQVFRSANLQTFTGLCCTSWGETVSVTEPAKPVAAVVTFSTDFQMFELVFIDTELSVNGGPCQSFGAGAVQQPQASTDPTVFDSRTFQYVVLPAEGLRSGKNTITLCGGGLLSETDTIVIGPNTLEVRLSK